MEVVAFGFPYGIAVVQKGYPSVSTNAGSITSLRFNEAKDALEKIQLDAVLNPGNSGGPVLDRNGKVIGVVVSGIRGSGVNQAIPVNILARFVSRPDIHFEPPQLRAANIYKPVLFEATGVAGHPIHNTNHSGTGPQGWQRQGAEHRLEAAADGKYQASVVPSTAATGRRDGAGAGRVWE